MTENPEITRLRSLLDCYYSGEDSPALIAELQRLFASAAPLPDNLLPDKAMIEALHCGPDSVSIRACEESRDNTLRAIALRGQSRKRRRRITAAAISALSAAAAVALVVLSGIPQSGSPAPEATSTVPAPVRSLASSATPASPSLPAVNPLPDPEDECSATRKTKAPSKSKKAADMPVKRPSCNKRLLLTSDDIDSETARHLTQFFRESETDLMDASELMAEIGAVDLPEYSPVKQYNSSAETQIPLI